METYEEFLLAGKYEIELHYTVCNLLNAIEYFYTMKTQKRAFPILSVLHHILTEENTEFNRCLIRLFISKFHRLPLY